MIDGQQIESKDFKTQKDLKATAGYIAMAMCNTTRASDTLEELLKNSGYRKQAEASLRKISTLCLNRQDLQDSNDPEDVFVWILTSIMNFTSSKEGCNLLVDSSSDRPSLLSFLLSHDSLQTHPNLFFRKKIAAITRSIPLPLPLPLPL